MNSVFRPALVLFGALTLVTASASGLDPEISVAAAQYQVMRIANARGLSAAKVSALIDTQSQGRVLGFLGEPRVDVLTLNIALAELPGQAQYNASPNASSGS